MKLIAYTSLVTLLALGSAACGHEAAPKPSAIGGASTAPLRPVARDTAPKPVPPQDPNANVALSDDIRVACDVHVSPNPTDAPKFAFDDSTLSPDDQVELDQLAKCLTTGKLAGRSILLTGRADPRGESEYNLGLGSRRAQSVREYLVSAGVGVARMELTSRGALDATGTDEESWRVDRRVDVSLL